MVKQKVPPKKDYLLYQCQLGSEAEAEIFPDLWWQKDASTYQFVAILRALLFQDASFLLVPQQGAWYRNAGVQLQVASPVREVRSGDVVVSTNEYDPGIWMRCGSEWTLLNEPAEKTVSAGKADNPVTSVACSPDGQWAAYVDRYSLLRVQTEISKAPSLTYGRHSGSVTALAWSPDGKLVASADSHGELHIWDFLDACWKKSQHAEGERILICQHRNQHVWSKITRLAWAPDGQMVATGSEHGVLRVWNAQSGREQWSAELHDILPIDSIIYSPQGSYLATAVEGKIHLWDTAAMMRIATFDVGVKNEEHLVLCWNPLADELLIGSSQRHAFLRCRLQFDDFWSLSRASQIPLAQFSRSQGVVGIAFAPGGRYAAVGCADGTIQMYDIEREALVHIYHAHKGGVLDLAWSINGARLISGGSDNRFCVWEPPMGVLSTFTSLALEKQGSEQRLLEKSVSRSS